MTQLVLWVNAEREDYAKDPPPLEGEGLAVQSMSQWRSDDCQLMLLINNQPLVIFRCGLVSHADRERLSMFPMRPKLKSP